MGFSGPQRVRQFIWLVLKQRLLTNSKRVRRGIAQDAPCQICGHYLEDNLHTFRDCPSAKEIWKQVIPPKYFDSFFTGGSMSAEDIISASFSWAYHFSSNYNAVVEYRLIRPTDPQDLGMCFYLNTDGVVHTTSGLSAAGGVIRDGTGKWIMGYNRHLGKCTVAVVEFLCSAFVVISQ
ncbi:hypothetical protein J1N35_045777 [Gossypium stocksii]|uniref:Reverse transcriptase zinc-binding domain-containing protein n=1 Tax=Gossypium stocksii TaxID=47602 RepID=A0A9D3UC63_9ROSI|nr:hypothetical protein J1N35_045777 [Gossypium stocksii]